MGRVGTATGTYPRIVAGRSASWSGRHIVLESKGGRSMYDVVHGSSYHLFLARIQLPLESARATPPTILNYLCTRYLSRMQHTYSSSSITHSVEIRNKRHKVEVQQVH
jgi:hypothetical protein